MLREYQVVLFGLAVHELGGFNQLVRPSLNGVEVVLEFKRNLENTNQKYLGLLQRRRTICSSI